MESPSRGKRLLNLQFLKKPGKAGSQGHWGGSGSEAIKPGDMPTLRLFVFAPFKIDEAALNPFVKPRFYKPSADGDHKFAGFGSPAKHRRPQGTSRNN
jgi:hypothetical protein